jgi:hypothetical protein
VTVVAILLIAMNMHITSKLWRNEQITWELHPRIDK